MLREEIRILVVDDVNTMRIQIRDLLRLSGFQKVTFAENGEDGIKTLSAPDAGFELMLVDWHMEPGTGMDLLSFVRGNDKFKNVSFIMVTAESTKERVVEAIKAGVDDYLVKPLTVAQIQTKVYGVLVKKGIL